MWSFLTLSLSLSWSNPFQYIMCSVRSVWALVTMSAFLRSFIVQLNSIVHLLLRSRIVWCRGSIWFPLGFHIGDQIVYHEHGLLDIHMNMHWEDNLHKLIHEMALPQTFRVGVRYCNVFCLSRFCSNNKLLVRTQQPCHHVGFITSLVIGRSNPRQSQSMWKYRHVRQIQLYTRNATHLTQACDL